MTKPRTPQSVFRKRQEVIDSYRRKTRLSQIFRVNLNSSRHAPSCDRCAEVGAPIAGVVVKPEIDEAELYCEHCFARTPMMRRAHPEWRYFTVTDGLDMDELAEELAAQGLLTADY